MQKIKEKIVALKNKILANDKSQLVSKKRKKILIAVAVLAVIVFLSIASQ